MSGVAGHAVLVEVDPETRPVRQVQGPVPVVQRLGEQAVGHEQRPERPPAAVLRAEVLGVFPVEVTDDLLETFRRLANQPDRGPLVEYALLVINP